MINYFEFTYFLVIVIIAAITTTGAFCSVGWSLSNGELKKERISNLSLRARIREQSLEIESLQAKNSFLLNRISEFDREGKEKSDVQM